ncbi:response regulator [Candidatus Parcubacteria bacterium]|nr:response regulator [Candidatus Parcubacteria bacterium]
MNKAYTVLIVDDDKFLLEMYRKKFEGLKITPDIATSGQETLEKLRGGQTPDVLVCDIIMPKMDGLELVETIRKENLAPNAIIVMLTNESKPETVEKAKSLGVEGYIVKATTVPSEVVEEIVRIADQHTK